MVGVRGARPGDDALRRDLDDCLAARCRAVVLFDRDVPSGGARNIESPTQVRELIAFLRETLGDGTLVAIDQEGGAVQRLRAGRGFVESPSAAAFAAMTALDRAASATALARQLASLGIDLNFAPCVDLAIDPASPIIAAKERSFGADGAVVVAMAREALAAHRAACVAACVKHFPGHGSAGADSHLGLPDVTAVWRERELAPFAALAGDTPAVMTGHLLHRGVDDDQPASLSREWTTGVLRGRLGFGGAVVTDSLDMRAIRDRFGAGEAAARALRAGADLALDANNMPGEPRACPAGEMAGAIARAVERGDLAPERVAASARRVDALLSVSGRGVRGAAPPHA